MGGSQIGAGGDRYLMTNRPSEGSRVTRQALDNPSRDNSSNEAFRNGELAKKYKDYTEAMRWFRKAADQGNGTAQTNIGLLYYNGEGVTQDYAEAMRWYHEAADQGYATAQTYIGNLYKNGEGMAKDYVEAMRWYRKAADQGNAEAQYMMGVLYYSGEGLPQGRNTTAALRWYQKAAKQGNANAQYMVGESFNGGIKRDEALKPLTPDDYCPHSSCLPLGAAYLRDRPSLLRL